MWWPSSVPGYPDEQASLDPLDPCFNPFAVRGWLYEQSGVSTVFNPEYSRKRCRLPMRCDSFGGHSGGDRRHVVVSSGIETFFLVHSPRRTAVAHWSQHPEYYWDCMFQRTNGVVEVAIFVYRVIGDLPGLVDEIDDGIWLRAPVVRMVCGCLVNCASTPLFGENHFFSAETLVTNIQSQSLLTPLATWTRSGSCPANLCSTSMGASPRGSRKNPSR